jgi:hypothetical protein
MFFLTAPKISKCRVFFWQTLSRIIVVPYSRLKSAIGTFACVQVKLWPLVSPVPQTITISQRHTTKNSEQKLLTNLQQKKDSS